MADKIFCVRASDFPGKLCHGCRHGCGDVGLDRVFVCEDNTGMRALFCGPLAKQVRNRRLAVSQEDALFFMACREDFVVSSPEKRPAAPLDEMFRLNAVRDFAKCAHRGLGNVAVEKQLHRAALPLPLLLPLAR